MKKWTATTAIAILLFAMVSASNDTLANESAPRNATRMSLPACCLSIHYAILKSMTVEITNSLEAKGYDVEVKSKTITHGGVIRIVHKVTTELDWADAVAAQKAAYELSDDYAPTYKVIKRVGKYTEYKIVTRGCFIEEPCAK